MTTEPLACLNGDWMPAAEARVSIWDRGFLFGDGVYEVWRIRAGRLWLETAHQRRLERSLRELELGGVDLDRLRSRCQETVERSGFEEGLLYLQITRGVAPRRHRFPEPGTPPTELIVALPYDDKPTDELRRTGVALVSQPDLRWGRCDIKSLNLLGNVLACEAASRANALEAILVDREGFVTEATHSSLLWIRDGRLEATPEGPSLLPGTSRHFLVDLARELGLDYAPQRRSLDELKQAEEAILTGTTLDVMPVIRIDDAVIGSGAPGAWTKRLGDAFRNAIERFRSGAPVSSAFRYEVGA